MTRPAFQRSAKTRVSPQFVAAMPFARLNITLQSVIAQEVFKGTHRCLALRSSARPIRTVRPTKFATIPALQGHLEAGRNASPYARTKTLVPQVLSVQLPTTRKPALAGLLWLEMDMDLVLSVRY